MSSVRRAKTLVTYWSNGAHRVHDFDSGMERECDALDLSILDSASGWISIEKLQSMLGRPDLDARVESLLGSGFLVRFDAPLTGRPTDRWEDWNPAAGFFHQVSRSYVPRVSGAPPLLTAFDLPSPLKQYPGRPTIPLPAFELPGRLDQALATRRTWRAFGDRPLTLVEMSALLGTAFRVQHWMTLDEGQRVALKTSPSGGARHSIEAYLLALRVEGLSEGTYHYAPDDHALSLLPPAASTALLKTFLPGQPGFHRAAAVVFMTSVFARMQWKYAHPHAYRVVFLDAGHLGQTFVLAATALGLAPFQTAALDSDAVDGHLGIDGVSESVIYAVGVGAQVEERTSARRHEGDEDPPLSDPAWVSRLGR